MRILLTIVISLACLFTKAQSHLPIGLPGYGYSPLASFTPSPAFMHYPAHDSLHPGRNWQLKPFASVSAGYVFLNGGISYLSAPVGLLLIHPLNNNLAAFGALSVAPSILTFNRLYTGSQNNQYPGNGFSKPYGLGGNARVEGGLIYTNDAKTFSISGSVGIERGSYPVYSSGRANTKRQ